MRDNKKCNLNSGSSCIRPDLTYCDDGDGCAKYYDPDEIKTDAPGSKPKPGDVNSDRPKGANPTKPVDPLERAKELAKKHWSFIEGLHKSCRMKSHILITAGYHYNSAFEHGYKHALEDIKSKEVIDTEGT